MDYCDFGWNDVWLRYEKYFLAFSKNHVLDTCGCSGELASK